MSGVITTGSHPKSLWPGVYAHFGLSYNQHEQEYPALFEVLTSSKAYEEDVQSTSFGFVPKKPEGKGVAYDSNRQGYIKRYVHATFAMGYQVTMEEQDDNQYEYVSKGRAKSLAFSTNQTVETLAANIYNRAFNSSYVGGDNVSLINSAHPLTDGGTFSNQITTAADLSEASLEDLHIQLMNATNDRGMKINLMGKSLHVAPANWFEATRILKSTLQNDTANNAINALKVNGVFPEGIKLNHYFTDPDAWFIRTKCPEGMKMFWRKKPVFSKDNDFETKNAKAHVIFRLALGWTDPRDLWGSPGA